MLCTECSIIADMLGTGIRVVGVNYSLVHTHVHAACFILSMTARIASMMSDSGAVGLVLVELCVVLVILCACTVPR